MTKENLAMTRKHFVCLLATAIAAFSQTYDEYMQRGAAAYNNGDSAGAIHFYQDALRANASSSMAKLHLSYVLLRQNKSKEDLDRVRAMSAEVLRVEPLNNNAQWNLALVASASQDVQAARGHCSAILARTPDHPQCLLVMGLLTWSQAYPDILAARRRSGLSNESQGLIPDSAIREELHRRHDAEMAQGLLTLSALRRLHPEHADAPAYQNLIQRSRACFARSEAESAGLMAEADAYVKEALSLHASESVQKPALLDPAHVPPMAAMPKLMAPPPPPPPPGL
jgi:tetratricopeptide (TPR) repeat protein